MRFVNNYKRIIFLCVLTLALVFSSSFGSKRLRCIDSAGALPCHEVEHNYYSDATYSTIVGYRFVTCSGVYTYGTVTTFVVSYDGGDCGCYD
jgi:hypothetical protein